MGPWSDKEDLSPDRVSIDYKNPAETSNFGEMLLQENFEVFKENLFETFT